MACRDASMISVSFDNPTNKLPKICLLEFESILALVAFNYWQMKPRVMTEALRTAN